MSLANVVTKRNAAATLLSAATGALAVTLLSGETLSVGGFMSNLYAVGGPVALGAVTVNWTMGEGSDKGGATSNAARALIGAGAAVAILMLAGVMPRELDAESLTMGGIVAGSIFVGDSLVTMF